MMRADGKPKSTCQYSISMSDFYDDQDFVSIDFTLQPFKKGEYDNCTFTDCNFENLHISNTSFLECTFIECNLTNVKFGGTTLNQVTFESCKLLGADFSICEPFMLDIRFRESILHLANFTQLPLKGTSLISCQVCEVDFTGADLSQAIFTASTLSKTIFENTNLTKADFTTAIDFSIDTTNNNMKGAMFSRDNLEGLIKHLQLNLN